MKQLKTKICLNKQNQKINIPRWKQIKGWLTSIGNIENYQIGLLNYNIVTDEYLLELNNRVLKHNYYTDIITFNLSDSKDVIEGDIYISIDRVNENATVFHVKRMEEMRRVMAHGLLHLCGYNDKTPQQKIEMKEKENFYLERYNTTYK